MRQAPYCFCPHGVHYDIMGAQGRVSYCRPAGSDPHDRIAGVDVVTYHYVVTAAGYRRSCRLWL